MLVRVASLAALPPGTVLEAEVDGVPYAVCNSHGEIHCFEGSCPCTGGPLGQGALREDLLVCPWHGWRFDPQSGISAYDCDVRIEKFRVEVRGDDILIEV
jgi:nitrite reductase (NADH) small subunit